MNRFARALTVLTIGAVGARMIFSGSFGWFVQQRMRIPLLIAAVILIILGGVEVVKSLRDERSDPETARISAGPLVSWLLIIPVFIFYTIQPTSLGVAAAARIDAYQPVEQSSEFDALLESEGPTPMKVLDFINRASWDESESLEGVPVELEGLVFNDPSVPDGFKLTKFMVSCCAADGVPLQVDLREVEGTFEDDTWVTATVVWIPPDVPFEEQADGQEWKIEAKAVSVVPIDDSQANLDPYESPY